MAKLRETTTERASVARLLDPSAFVAGDTVASKPQQVKHARSKYRKRQVVLSDEAESTLQRLTATLRAVTGTRLTTSHAVRGLLTAIAPAIPELSLQRPPAEATCLPNNAPRFDSERERFERAIAGMVHSALTRTM